MDKNLENKLNQILEKVSQIDELSLKVSKIDELSKKVDKIDGLSLKFDKLEKTMEDGFAAVDKKFDKLGKKLDNYIDFSSERMTNIEDSVDSARKEILKEIQTTKLDSLDKFASTERVDGHEIRIKNLEEKII